MSGRSIRQKTGGRSDRYEERRAQRGVTTANAPTWQDGAARAAYSALASRCAASKKSKVAVMRQLLGSQSELEMFMLRVRASETDAENIREVLEFHRKKVESLGPEEARKACEMAKRTLVARGGMGGFGELRVISTSVPPSASIKSFLSSSEELKKERLRSLGRATRPGRNLFAWSTDWMDPDVPGIVCFERAFGEMPLEIEDGGAPPEAFVKKHVHTEFFPTAVGSGSDHYVVMAKGKPPRYMSVGEVARSFGVSEESDLYYMLEEKDSLTPNQAVACLGRSVHVGVATSVVGYVIL